MGSKILVLMMVLVSVMQLHAQVIMPALQIVNKTGSKTAYPAQPIVVEVFLGADKSVYSHVEVAPFSSAPIKVPGIPGKFTVQYTRGGLMGPTDIGVLEVPVVEGTQLLFYDDSYVIVQPKNIKKGG